MDHRRDVQTLPAQKNMITKSLGMPALVLCLPPGRRQAVAGIVLCVIT